VAEKVRELYGIEGGENATPGGGPCWESKYVRMAKQTILFDCLFEAAGIESVV